MSPEELAAACARAVGDAGTRVEFGLVRVSVAAAGWVAALTALRDDAATAFDYFDMLCGVDEADTGFGVVVHLWSTRRRHQVLVDTVVPREQPQLASLTGVWPGANWHEREAAEMYGLIFDGHPALVPLLLPDGFTGHPMRKDFVLAARAAKSWPGAKEPGEESSRRPAVAAGQPLADSGWPKPLATETAHPEGG